MQESLRILVVDDDTDHDLSEITNAFAQDGWTPQIVRMTTDEWTMSGVGVLVDYMSAVRQNITSAEQMLLRQALYPIATESRYLFHLSSLYAKLGSDDNTKGTLALAIEQIIATYLHSDESPLVAVVVSDRWLQHDISKVWIDQFPEGVKLWCMLPANGRLTRVVYDTVLAQTT